jgi:hypothetical protein
MSSPAALPVCRIFRYKVGCAGQHREAETRRPFAFSGVPFECPLCQWFNAAMRD